MNNQTKRDGLAKVREVAAYLGLSRAGTYRLMDRGDLPYVKLGASRRIRWVDVDECVERFLVARSA